MKHKWHLDSSMKSRIMLSFTILLLFVAVLLAGIITIQISLSSELNDIYDDNRMMLILNEDVQSLKILTEQYLSTKTTTSLEEIHNIMNELNLTAYEMKNTLPVNQVNMKIRDIGYMIESLTNHVNIALRAKMNANIAEYTENFEHISTLTRYIGIQCDESIALIAE